MHDDLAGPVYAVINAGLNLHRRLERNPGSLDLQKEQSNLKEVLRKVPNVGEEKFGNEEFLGIRYPLICWLDEIFILKSSWKSEWTESSLEMALSDSRHRAWKFWEQAQLAESRVSIDAVEVFYLCAALGFRGDRYKDVAKLQEWQTATEGMLFAKQHQWSVPAEIQPPTHVPPLHGTERKQTMMLLWAVSLLVLIPVAMFFLIKLIS